MATETPKRGPGRPRKDPDEVTEPVPIRGIRIPDERWAAAERAATATGTNRSQLVNDLLAWHLGEPGAKRPKRPEASE